MRHAPPGFHCDGHGLNLRVDPSGARRWVQRLVVRGRPRMLGLGGYPLVSLAEAREAAFANRKIARSGGDPFAARRRARGVPTFEEAAATVFALHRSGWRSADYSASLVRLFRRYVHPHIGTLAVSDVTTADVLTVLTPIWHAKPNSARRVRQRIGAVMKWAVAQGYRQDNPAGDVLGQALGRQHAVVRHMRALPHREVADAIRRMHATSAPTAVKLAFEFLVLTAARSGEVRAATWDEMDLDAAVWTMPASHTKSNREHRVPLSHRAVAILQEARRLGRDLLFPSTRGRQLRDTAISRVLNDLGIAAVPHGFRSSFRDWAAEQTNARQDVIEASLAHLVRDPTVAAYARSDLFERRRRLLDDWAAYLGKRGLTEAQGKL